MITAYHEEKVIQAKLDNALALDYPAAKLEIVVAPHPAFIITDWCRSASHVVAFNTKAQK